MELIRRLAEIVIVCENRIRRKEKIEYEGVKKVDLEGVGNESKMEVFNRDALHLLRCYATFNVYLSIYLHFCQSVCSSVSLTVCVSVCLSVCLSV